MGLRLQNWDVRHKGTQVKIDADIIIEKFLIDEIRKSFPEDEIISEEEFETTPQKKQHKNYWLLDPIDGTSSFVKVTMVFAVKWHTLRMDRLYLA